MKERARALKEDHIISAAHEAIAKNGGFLVSIDDVARTAKISKGAVLHYFPSKKDLFEAVFKRFFERIFLRCQVELAKVTEPLEKLKGFADFLYDEDDPDIALGYPLYFECMYRAVNDEIFRDLYRDWISNWITMLEEIIQEGTAKGTFKNIDPVESAMAISAIYQGVASRWYLDRSRHTSQWAQKKVKETVDLIVGISE
ncbi:MAG: TetR/AcrR family transcriptional regulator [Myxococcota bacterium]|nr:TetR/AcrR family transcriptional regulator [Myxococcota bacterium]